MLKLPHNCTHLTRSKVMLKILQARLQQYVNCEIPVVQARFRKGRGTRDQIANIRWIIKKVRELQKTIYFHFIDYAKAFDSLYMYTGKNTGVGCHFLFQCMKVKSESEVAQSCPTLSNPMDCSLPGSSVHGIFQARVLELGGSAFSSLMYITSWQIDGETVERVRDFILEGSKITVDCGCSHEIKRRLLLGREAMTNLDSMLKSRDSTLSTKVHLVRAMVFPVVLYGCESWTIKIAECRRIDGFEL